jgi:hypothetical protein
LSPRTHGPSFLSPSFRHPLPSPSRLRRSPLQKLRLGDPPSRAELGVAASTTPPPTSPLPLGPPTFDVWSRNIHHGARLPLLPKLYVPPLDAFLPHLPSVLPPVSSVFGPVIFFH